MADDLETQLTDNAAAPKRVIVDGQHVEQHSLKEQIQLADRKLAIDAAKGRTGGIRRQKLSPPGASE